MNPFMAIEDTERRLRFDVLNLAYRMHADGLVQTDGDSVCATARTLMGFIDTQEATV